MVENLKSLDERVLMQVIEAGAVGTWQEVVAEGLCRLLRKKQEPGPGVVGEEEEILLAIRRVLVGRFPGQIDAVAREILASALRPYRAYAPKAETSPWIPVGQSLPPLGRAVVVTRQGFPVPEYYMVARLANLLGGQKIWMDEDERVLDPTHWMEIPELPKEETNDGQSNARA